MLLCLVACKKQGNDFRLTGGIAQLPDTVVSLYGLFAQPDSIVTVPVEEGRIDFSLPMDTITPLCLYVASRGEELPLFADKRLTIRVEGDTLKGQPLRATGGALQAEYNAFLDSIAGLDSLPDIVGKAEAFITAHPQSVVSIYLIDKYFVRTNQPDKAQIERMITLLSGIMHDHPYIMALQEKLKNMPDRKRDRYVALGSLQDSTGTLLNSADYKDKFVVISLWASWHRQSRSMQDSLKQTVKRFAKRPVKFISLSLDANREEWLSAVRADTLPGVHVCDFKGWSGGFLPICGATELPALYVLNANGRIAATDKWGEELEEYLDKKVKVWEEQQKKKKNKSKKR